jgi:hypothetical protein
MGIVLDIVPVQRQQGEPGINERICTAKIGFILIL